MSSLVLSLTPAFSEARVNVCSSIVTVMHVRSGFCGRTATRVAAVSLKSCSTTCEYDLPGSHVNPKKVLVIDDILEKK